MKQLSRWTLNKLIVLLVLGGFAMLLMEIRYTHRDVLGEQWLSWTPLVYSALMLLAGIAALCLWERGGRKVLFWCFAVGLIVGPLGLWLHTGKHPARGLKRVISAWTLPIKHGDEKQGAANDAAVKKGGDASGGKPDNKKGDSQDKPPVLAPLAFCGLGLLGMLACAARFQSLEEEKSTP